MHPLIRRAVGVALLGATLTGCASASTDYDSQPHPTETRLQRAGNAVLLGAAGGWVGFYGYGLLTNRAANLPDGTAISVAAGAALFAGIYALTLKPERVVVPQVRTRTVYLKDKDASNLRDALEHASDASAAYKAENAFLRSELARKPRVEYRTIEDTVYIGQERPDLPENVFLMRIGPTFYSFPTISLGCQTDPLPHVCLSRDSIIADPLRPGNELHPGHP